MSSKELVVAPGGSKTFVVAKEPKGKKGNSKGGKNAKKKQAKASHPQVRELVPPPQSKKKAAAYVKKKIEYAVSRNPDLSTSWKVRELEVLARNEINRDLSADPWDVNGGSSTNLWQLLFATIIAKIDACNPGFFVSAPSYTGASAASISPADLAMYLHIIKDMYLSKVGVCPAQAKSALAGVNCNGPFNVPHVMAILLQYFAPYSKDSAVFKMTTQSAGAYTVGASNALSTAAAGTVSRGMVPVFGRQAATVPATTGEVAGAAGIAGTTYVNMIPQMDGVSALLETVCPCVPLSNIGTLAPDASGYCVVNNVGLSGNMTIASSVAEFDPEMAFLLGQIISGAQIPGLYNVPAPSVQFGEMTALTNVVTNPTDVQGKRQNMLMGFVESLWRCPAILNKPVKWLLARSEYGVLTSFIVIPRTVHLALWHAYTTILAAGIVASGASRDDVISFCAYLDMVLVAKLGQFNNWSRTADSAYYCYDRSLLSASLPLHAKQFLESIGPVIRGGRLQIPQLLLTGGDFLLSSQSTTLRGDASVAFPYRGMFNDATATASVPAIGPGAGVSQTVVNGFTAGILYPSTPVVFTQYYKQQYMKYAVAWGSGSSTSIVGGLLALFPLDAVTVLGDILNHAQVCPVVAGTTVSGGNQLGATGITARDVSIIAIASFTSMSRIDLSRVFQTCFYDYIPAGGSGSIVSSLVGALPYFARIPAGVRPAAELVEGDTSTFAREAATNSVTGRKGGIRSIDGHTVDTTQSNPLAIALAPVLAMTAASLLPPAINFVANKLQPRASSLIPPAQYSNFGEAPQKAADAYSEGQRKIQELQHMYTTYKGVNPLQILSGGGTPMQQALMGNIPGALTGGILDRSGSLNYMGLAQKVFKL